ncbi:Crp/Fnr family transcriptional regulator [Mitsuaria sp. TWR114]|uniref:Crp/Fnr family transcriptional regulator n=1 Tax=Mitsuaria sp. TWR114 TaxID=2601731 RepID=UPI0011BF42FF|nr:Crp/Fnr family transcriptional regulator [Mitsuaria sp. TWR114]TXD85010.1 Crp/Fnr family transcriptional regulator [Mitsuaria sp. TWR114]
MTADFLSDPAAPVARGVSSPAAAEGDAAHNAALMPGPAHPVPWRALLGDVLLEADDWSALASMARVRRCRAGDLAVRRGDAAVAMVALCEGRVVAGGPLAGPRLAVAGDGVQVVAGVEDARIVSATALVMEWPMAAATLWLRSQPPVLAALLRASAAQLREAQDALRGLTTKDATARIAAWLLAQAGGSAEVRLAERKRDVAARLSISPETLSRALRQLADRGILAVQGYRIGLLDPVALLALARCGRAA